MDCKRPYRPCNYVSLGSERLLFVLRRYGCHPFGLALMPDHFLYMADAIAGRILKIDPQGRIVGSINELPSGQGPHFDPHEIAVGPDGSIFTAEVVGWRAEKLRPK